jgi:transcriptional regulator with XRE-family HTH domain
MKIAAQLTDESVLKELGGRLAGARLGRNLTQAELAEQAGVSKRTVERLESGAVATQLSGFLRVCRVLGLVERFESLVPEVAASPMEQLKRQGGKRQRATGKKAVAIKPGKWTWGDES